MSARTVLVFVELLAASIWVGGYVAIVIVTRIIRRQLAPADQIAFFRAVGREFGAVTSGALVVALAGGAVLLADRPWDATATAAVVVAAVLVVATLAGVRQAREMTRLRRRAVRADGAEREQLVASVRRGAARARTMRMALGAVTLVLVALAAVLAT